MARFLSAIQLEVAGLGNKIDEKMKTNFAQQEASLLHKLSDGQGVQELRDMITELKEAMASGLGEMSKRLMDLDGKA